MDPFSHELNELLVSTYREITRIEELALRGMSKNTLSIAELHMLDAVGRDGCTVTDIAQSMGISMPSVTIAIKKLEKKGYVTKERDPEDARKVRIRLTLEGRRAEAAHHWFHRQMVHNVGHVFKPEDRELLLNAIRQLDEFFKEKAHELEKAYPMNEEDMAEMDAE